MDVQEGNKVIIDKYAGNEITYNDEEFLIVENDDILAIVE
jgi:chaperonin 10 Kd subunit